MTVALYAIPLLIALLNLVLMRRPGRKSDGPALTALIPARNEAENLRALVPVLVGQGMQVIVFDDESDDPTAEVARQGGALVMRAREPLPEGWTGKNRACHELAKAAAEASPSDWWVFLDADVQPGPGFHDALRDLVATVGLGSPVITGFPKTLPGRGIEPLFLGWVDWILLVTNPFGFVSRTRMGHNRFINGQFSIWRSTTYTSLWPNEQVRGSQMEDVMTGRLLVREGIRVEVVNLTSVLSVRMYRSWREAPDGMSKNTFEIANSVAGTVGLAMGFMVVGWGWALSSHWATGLGLLIASGFVVAAIARSAMWPALLMPVTCTLGAFTVLRSLWWRWTGKTTWKGRAYTR